MIDLAPRQQVRIPDASVSIGDVAAYLPKEAEELLTNFADGFATSGATMSRGANFKDIFTNPAGAFILTLAIAGVSVVTIFRIRHAIEKIRKAKLKELQELLIKEKAKKEEEIISDRAQDPDRVEKILRNINALRNRIKSTPLKTIDARKKYFEELNQDKTVAQDKSKLNLSTFGTSVRWFIPVFCVFGMILFSVDGGLTLNLLTQFFSSPIGISITVASVAAGAGAGLIRRFANSKFKQLIRKRKLSAPQEYEANLKEFEELMKLIPDEGDNSEKIQWIRSTWEQIRDYKFYAIENKRTRSPAQVEMQKEFLSGLRSLIDMGLPTFDVFKENHIFTLNTVLPETIDNNTELTDEEKSDLSVDMNTLPKADRWSVFRSVFGFSFMWFLIALSLPGIDFTSIPALLALFTSPPGWIILGVCVIAAIVAVIPKVFSKRRLKLKERRERVQQYLLEYEDRRKERNDPHINALWEKINQIDDIALRAQLQREALANRQVEDEVLKNHLKTNKAPEKIIFNDRNKYVLYHEGKLTRTDKWSVVRSAIGSYLNVSIPVFCVAGLVLVNITAGLIGFGAIAMLFTTPVGWGLIAVAVTVGIIFAARKAYVKTKEKIQEREEKAAAEMEFNELEFNRLKFTGIQQSIWDDIKNSSAFNHSAKVELQRDFLKCVMYDKAHYENQAKECHDFFNNFVKLQITQKITEKNKTRIIPSFEKNKSKYDAIQKNKLTLGDFSQVLKSSATSLLIGAPILGLAALMVTIGVTAGVLTVMGPIGWAFLGVAIIVAGTYMVYTFNKQRNLKLAERETNAETEVATNNTEFEKLMGEALELTHDQKQIISEKFQEISTLGHNKPATAEIQKDFLEGLKAVVINPQKHYEIFEENVLNKIIPVVALIAPMAESGRGNGSLISLSKLSRESDLTQPTHMQSEALFLRDSRENERDRSQEQDSSLLPSKPTFRIPLKMTLCERFSMWKANIGKWAGNIRLTRNPNQGYEPLANPKDNDLNSHDERNHTTAPPTVRVL
jgi:hypothetical protein